MVYWVTDRKREALRLCHSLHHRCGLCGRLRTRLESLGWRACVTSMGFCLWSRDNGSLHVFCIPFDGVWHVWPAVSWRDQKPSFEFGQSLVLRSGYGGRSCTCVSTAKNETHGTYCLSPNKSFQPTKSALNATAIYLNIWHHPKVCDIHLKSNIFSKLW